MGFHLSTSSKPNTEFNSDLAPCDFGAFPTMKREMRGKKFRGDQRSAARFSRSGWSVVRSASVAEGGTSKETVIAPLQSSESGVIRRVHELFKRPSYVAQIRFSGLFRIGIKFWNSEPLSDIVVALMGQCRPNWLLQ
jgi:hypothetical protein